MRHHRRGPAPHRRRQATPSWPVYLCGLHAKLDCNAVLLLVAIDEAVAKRGRQAHLHRPSGLRPHAPRARPRRGARHHRAREGRPSSGAARRDGRRTRVGAHEALPHVDESFRRPAGALPARVLSKKSRSSFIAVERDTPEHRERREEFCALLKKADLSSLVFIDESFVKNRDAPASSSPTGLARSPQPPDLQFGRGSPPRRSFAIPTAAFSASGSPFAAERSYQARARRRLILVPSPRS